MLEIVRPALPALWDDQNFAKTYLHWKKHQQPASPFIGRYWLNSNPFCLNNFFIAKVYWEKFEEECSLAGYYSPAEEEVFLRIPHWQARDNKFGIILLMRWCSHLLVLLDCNGNSCVEWECKHLIKPSMKRLWQEFHYLLSLFVLIWEWAKAQKLSEVQQIHKLLSYSQIIKRSFISFSCETDSMKALQNL